MLYFTLGYREEVDLSVEIFNRTKYNDEVLKEAAEFAHKVCGIEGEVAVIFRYHANSTGYIGLQHDSYPYFREVAKDLKKFENKKYMLNRADYNPNSVLLKSDRPVAMATKDGAFGYITVRMPRPSSGSYLTLSATGVMNTILHEMYHIKQTRNREWALKDFGCSDWKKFNGYSGRYAAKRVKHQSRPIEQHVNRLLRDVQPTLDNSFDYKLCVEGLIKEFSSEENIKKTKKQKQQVKYNKFGQRISDYRNVKMKKLRSGDEIVECPHCGEQAVNIDYDTETFTHIAAIDDEMVRHGYPASEARYTQFGHMMYTDGSVGVVEWGYVSSTGDVDEEVFKVYNSNPYRRYYR